MFRQRPRLPVNFYFPTFRNTEAPMRGASAKCVDEYVATVCNQLGAALQEAQAQSTAEVQWQKQYYGWKMGTMDLKPDDLVLVKADTFKGERKIKDRWEDKLHKVVHQIMMDIPSYEVTNQHRQSHILHCNWLLLIASETGIPLCVDNCHAWDRWTSPTLVKPTPKGSESKIMPWVDCGLVSVQHQASKTSLGWINGRLQLLHGHLPECPLRKGKDFR